MDLNICKLTLSKNGHEYILEPYEIKENTEVNIFKKQILETNPREDKEDTKIDTDEEDTESSESSSSSQIDIAQETSSTSKIDLSQDIKAIKYFGRINERRYKKFFLGQKQEMVIEFDPTTKYLIVDGHLFKCGKKLLQFLFSDKTKKPKLSQINGFLLMFKGLSNISLGTLAPSIKYLIRISRK